VDVEPVGGAAIVVDDLIDGVLEARLVLSVDLLVSNAQLSLIFLCPLPPIRSRSDESYVLQGQVIEAALEFA